MARKKRGKPHEEEASEAWLLPYSDLMTLLLALFIVLYGISQTDQQKMEAVGRAFNAAFNMGGVSFFSNAGSDVGKTHNFMSTQDMGASQYLEENRQLEKLQQVLAEYIEQNHLQDELSTMLTEDGLVLRIKEKALFPSGSAELVPEAQKIGPVIAGLLATIPEQVIITGHTDNVPIATERYPSNWELSTQRALNFMKFLMAQNASLNPSRFSAIGYGEYRPVDSNETETGRAQNRRVEVLVARMYREGNDMEHTRF